MKKAYCFLQIILYPFYKLFFGIRFSGRENELPAGPCLVCANHISMHDICVLALALRRPLFFVAKSEVFKSRLVARFMRHFGVIPVRRGDANIGSLQKTISVLKEGNCVGIFPQGTRRRGVAPEETEVKSGVGMLAFRAKCPVLPVRIRTAGNRVRFFRRITVTVGRPIPYEALGFTKGNMAEYDGAARLIFDRICSLDRGETTK